VSERERERIEGCPPPPPPPPPRSSDYCAVDVLLPKCPPGASVDEPPDVYLISCRRDDLTWRGTNGRTNGWTGGQTPPDAKPHPMPWLRRQAACISPPPRQTDLPPSLAGRGATRRDDRPTSFVDLSIPGHDASATYSRSTSPLACSPACPLLPPRVPRVIPNSSSTSPTSHRSLSLAAS
jgi:hypothetical protein